MVTDAGAAAERSDLSLRAETRMKAGGRANNTDGSRDADGEAWPFMLCRQIFSNVHRSGTIVCLVMLCRRAGGLESMV